MTDHLSEGNVEKSPLLFIGQLTIFWLLAPYLIFIFSYYEYYLIIPSILIIGFIFRNSVKTMRYISTPLLWHGKYTLPALVVATISTWLSGIIPPLGLSFDWEKHFQLLNLLASENTYPPITYLNNEPYLLRYNIAIYEVPAMLEKILPIGVRYWMALYQIVGLTLFFIMLFYMIEQLTKSKTSVARNTLIAFIFMGFSGLDLLGTIYTDGPFYPERPSLEWWASEYSFLSSLGQFFWMPQHCVPAWIGIALLYLNAIHSGRLLQQSLPLLILLIFFWSPLILFGFLFLLPLYLTQIICFLKKTTNIFLSFAMFFILLLPMMIFFKTGTSSIPKYLLWGTPVGSVSQISITLLFEVFFYILLLFFCIKDRFNRFLLFNMGITFIMCTTFHFGFHNDFALKASMPGLTLLAIFLVAAILGKANSVTHKIARIILFSCFVIGLATPFCEIARGYLYRPEFSKLNATTPEGGLKDFFSQYFIPISEKPFFIRDE